MGGTLLTFFCHKGILGVKQKGWFDMKKIVVCGVVALSLMACDDESVNVAEPAAMAVLDSGETLTACTQKNVGGMAYVTDSAGVFYCADGKWQAMNDRNVPNTGFINMDSTAYGASPNRRGIDANDGGNIAVRSDTVVIRDTVIRFDTTRLIYEPKYDTVTTKFLNQEMLAAKKYGTFIDSRDNKVYRTVKIGTQTWMAQNLNYDGVMSYCPGNTEKGCDDFGRLYTWAKAMKLDDSYNEANAFNSKGKDSILVRPVQGVCPKGWHVADSIEFATLTEYAIQYAGNNHYDEPPYETMSSQNEDAWEEDYVGTDRLGFSAVGTGEILNGTVNAYKKSSLWWIANEKTSNFGYEWGLFEKEGRYWALAATAKSLTRAVRCVKNK